MSGTTPFVQYEKGRFKATCGPCGATFEVVIMGGPMVKASDETRAEYECPECGQPYHCRGLASPKVTLLSPRTDGARTRVAIAQKG